MTLLLEVENLFKSFGSVMAVFELGFTVNRGEILGIIGPNGAGKTTLFHLISGEYRPDSGRIAFDGLEVTSVPLHRRCRLGIARTYQIPRPFLHMTVQDNLIVGAIYGGGLGYKTAKAKSSEILELAGLISKKDVLAGALPLLDRKRLELAKALATQPILLLVDEVAGGLTEAEVEELLSIIHQVRQNGVTIMWVEHIMMAMQKGPDRLLVMNFGQKIFLGTPAAAFESEEVQQIYLGAEED